MTKEEIKRTTSMKDVLNMYGIRIHRNGMCSCPFHKDDTPSMKVYPDGFKCFGCNEAGDIFDFVVKMDRCDFKTAFQVLGGTYEHVKPIEREVRNTSYKRQREEAERKEKAEAEFKAMVASTITICRRVIDLCEPIGDMWTDAQNHLTWLLYIWDLKYMKDKDEEGKVDELNVYRKCRAIKQRFGVG